MSVFRNIDLLFGVPFTRRPQTWASSSSATRALAEKAPLVAKRLIPLHHAEAVAEGLNHSSERKKFVR